MKLGIVSDEIARDFASAVRVGVPLGLRRYEIRNLAAGRAPMCGEAAMLEVERIARGEGVEITALSPGLFKNTEDAAAFRREMDQVYPRAVEWAHRWKLPGLIVFGFHKPGATEATAPEFSSANPPGACPCAAKRPCSKWSASRAAKASRAPRSRPGCSRIPGTRPPFAVR